MKNILHIYANRYPSLDSKPAILKKWIDLASVCDEYHVLARSEKNNYHHEIQGNLHLHRVPKLGNQCRSIYITGLIIFYLIPKYKISGLLVNSAILGGLYAVWASKIFGIPMMVEIHGDEYFRYLKISKSYYYPIQKMIHYVFRNAKIIRSLSPKMTAKLAQHGYSQNVVEIPNRVDLDLFDTVKKNFKIEKIFHLISIGHFVPTKNYRNLIRFLADLKLDFKLTLIGGGSLKNEYLELIRQLELSDKVLLHDKMDQKELVRELIKADVYIQYSNSEGVPRTILEAMSVKVPVVSTRVGSIEGILVHNETGIFVDLDDPTALKNELYRLYNDQALRERLSENAYNLIKEKYSWDYAMNKYIKSLLTLFN